MCVDVEINTCSYVYMSSMALLDKKKKERRFTIHYLPWNWLFLVYTPTQLAYYKPTSRFKDDNTVMLWKIYTNILQNRGWVF